MNKLEILQNTIINGICLDISKAKFMGAVRGSLILTYCGIDTMAFLAMPSSQEEVRRIDFINWVNRYMRINNNIDDLYPAEDLYSGRCALVHSYGVESRSSRMGKTRLVGYGAGLKIHKLKNQKMILFDIELFIKDFKEGVIRFLEEAKKDKLLLKNIDVRIEKLVCIMPIKNPSDAFFNKFWYAFKKSKYLIQLIFSEVFSKNQK